MALADLVGPGIRLAREGAPINTGQAYILEILAPIHALLPGTRELYAPDGRWLGEGDTFRFPELAEALERFAAEGAEPFYRGELAAQISAFVLEGGGTLGSGDLASYRAVERPPIVAPFRGTEVLTNPPPSSGGILIAYCLGLLERFGERSGPEQLVAAMEAANDRRDLAFAEALYEEGMHASFLDPAGLDLAAADLLGSTTHISVLDARGQLRQRHLLQRLGLGGAGAGHRGDPQQHAGRGGPQPGRLPQHRPGRRVPSMMAPTVVLRDGEVVLAVGSAGSNRIRSAILQTVVRAVEQGYPVAAAVEAPRLHFEAGIVQAELGVDSDALDRMEARGVKVARWPSLNLFFGGTQAVARDPRTGELSGGGDPRRGGAVAYAD